MINTATKIIGGVFGLEIEPSASITSPPPFITGRELFLANAHSGIHILAEKLAPKQVWMPSFLCEVMPESVNPQRSAIRYYAIDAQLKVASTDWLEDVQPGDLVIFIAYFGFPADTDLMVQAKQRGAWILEDASQALLTPGIGDHADFALYSPRKFLSVPDGGILQLKEASALTSVTLNTPDEARWLKALRAVLLRGEYDRHGGSRAWFEWFREAENADVTGFYAMSDLTRTLLLNHFDYDEMTRRRVENYRYLAAHLGELAIFPELPDHVVPLGFPIRLEARDALRLVLFQHEIYPPVHWPVEGIVPPEFTDSHRLADEIMTLPCDQRYNEADMARMAHIIVKEMER